MSALLRRRVVHHLHLLAHQATGQRGRIQEQHHPVVVQGQVAGDRALLPPRQDLVQIICQYQRPMQLRDEFGRLSEAIGANQAADEKVSRAEDASNELAAARAAASAVATTLTFALEPDARKSVRLDGEVLANTPLAVSTVTKRTIAIDGVCEISIGRTSATAKLSSRERASLKRNLQRPWSWWESRGDRRRASPGSSARSYFLGEVAGGLRAFRRVLDPAKSLVGKIER